LPNITAKNHHRRDHPGTSLEYTKRHTPGDGLESAITQDLPSTLTNTAIVRGVNDSTGVALAEVYDISYDTNHCRKHYVIEALYKYGRRREIGGFLACNCPKESDVRALGPELTQYGVPKVWNDRLGAARWHRRLIAAMMDGKQPYSPAASSANGRCAAIIASGLAPADRKGVGNGVELPAGKYHCDCARCKQ